MPIKSRFSLAYLTLEITWISLALGFLTFIIHAPINTEAQFFTVPFIGACSGAAVGGVWGQMQAGAKGGLLAGFGLMLLGLAAFSGR